MLFNLLTLRGLTAGTVDRTFRRWRQPRAKIGSRFTTQVGVVEVTAVEQLGPADLTESEANRAGYPDLVALTKWLAKQSGELYRISIRLAGPDPRLALRERDRLTETEHRQLSAKLDRMDAAADRPWTRTTLKQVHRRPGVVSTELAAAQGVDRDRFKTRVRRLKALGLTESLETGYRLSARGRAFLLADPDAAD